jgi:hypothetical protein
MSDNQMADYEAKWATAARLAAEVLPHNKQILFEALAEAGIAVVVISFDGAGDEGQFTEPCAFDAENREAPIPATDIVVKKVEFETAIIVGSSVPIMDYLETLACEFLEATHEGWEIGEGAQGEFRFTVTGQSITLDYNERYIEYNRHEHQF